MDMLIFISDLHLVDGSAGEHHTPLRAFEYFFEDVIGIATKPSNQGKIKEIKLVLLGDIFDLLRTEHWFEGIKEDERPWGHQEDAIEAHALDILEKIATCKNVKTGVDNAEALKFIRNRFKYLKRSCKLDTPAVLGYIPGNHDRLINHQAYTKLRNKVRELLGLPQPDQDQLFPHHFFDPEYGVLARHGHEFDRYNYEGGTAFTQEDYQRVPIGDPITTELIARLPYELKRRLEVEPIPPKERQRLIANFQEIENVRPLSAVIQWLLYQVSQTPDLKGLIEDVVDAVIKSFNDLQFVKDWYAHHDQWRSPFDEADKIQMALYLLEKFKVFPTEKLLSLAIKTHDYFAKDYLLEVAPREFAYDDRVRYVVHGHTHDPLVMPIRIRDAQEQVYLNTGTWRTRYQKSTQDASFVSWKNMTYLIFYKKGERDADFPTYETWTGTLKVV